MKQNLFFFFLLLLSHSYAGEQSAFSLEKSESLALCHNHDLQRLRQEVRRDCWTYWEQVAQTLPSINASGSFTRSNVSRLVGTEELLSSELRLNQLVLSIPIYQQIREAHWRYQSTLCRIAEQTLFTILQVRVAHCEVILTKQLLKIQQSTLELLKTSYENEDIKLNYGESTGFDANRNHLAYTNALSLYYQLKERLETVKNEWIRLLGISPFCAHEYDVEESEVPLDHYNFLSALIQSLEEKEGQICDSLFKKEHFRYWNSIAHETRPLLQQARAEKNVAEAARKAAIGRYLPEVQSFATYTNTNNRPPGVSSSETSYWELGLNFSWDLFDGGARESQIRRLQSEVCIASINENQFKQELFLEIQDRANALQQALYSHRTALKSVELANEGIRFAKERLDLGAITAIEYRDMVQSLGQARFTLAQSTFGIMSGYYSLLASLGVTECSCLLKNSGEEGI